MKTYIDTANLNALAKANGCKYLNDVQVDINELSSSKTGSTYIWIVAKNGTLLQKLGAKSTAWFDRYSRSCCKVYEITVEHFDELSIADISLEQAQIELKIAV